MIVPSCKNKYSGSLVPYYLSIYFSCGEEEDTGGDIYKYFHASTKRENCPECDTKLGGKPLKNVVADTSL